MDSISLGALMKAINVEYNLKLSYDVLVSRDGGIPGYVIEWCNKNIKNRWGWYFRMEDAFLSFSDEKDHTLAALHWTRHKR